VVYRQGVNEKLLGDFIRKHNLRDKIFSKSSPWMLFCFMLLIRVPALVASKCGFTADFKVTNSASHIAEYIDGTIERLGFAPDLYYLHRIDPSKKM
jgi:aryl-alcohol dehydrogenase-like predicted oxidoreductase